VPPMVTQGTNLAADVPGYAEDVQDFVNKNKRLREIDEKYDITGELQKQAAQLPGKIGDAAKILGDLGLGLVNSVFALLNIMILSIFLVARGRSWVDAGLRLRPAHEQVRIRRILDRTAAAVSGYVQGALTVALIAGVQTYIALTILGVPFRAPLAVLAGLFSLIPLVGATIAAIIIGIVTLFTNFPTATIVWTIWAIVYQQIENNVIQPQIQRRTVQIQPFLVLVAVLFGSTLLGVVGALVAIPLAATVQILVQELWMSRQEARRAEAGDEPPPSAEGTAGAIAPAT
jgi:predicted PurR-regulated permease PerM